MGTVVMAALLCLRKSSVGEEVPGFNLVIFLKRSSEWFQRVIPLVQLLIAR